MMMKPGWEHDTRRQRPRHFPSHQEKWMEQQALVKIRNKILLKACATVSRVPGVAVFIIAKMTHEAFTAAPPTGNQFSFIFVH